MIDDTSQPFELSVRLKNAEVAELLNRLDQRAPLASDSFAYRNRAVVQIRHKDASTWQRHRVPFRSISPQTLRFLHGAFVYDGTHVRAELISLSGGTVACDGLVASCTYLDHGIHEVLVELPMPIDPSEYSPSAQVRNVLLIDHDELTVTLARLHFERLGVRFHQATTCEEAMELAQWPNFDATLLDVAPGKTGAGSIQTLRAAGYIGRILVLSGSTDDDAKQKALARGADGFFCKPCRPGTYDSIIDGLQATPIASSLRDDTGFHDVIRHFVDEMPTTMRSIERMLREDEHPVLTKTLRMLREKAVAFGFEPVATAAAEIEASITDADLHGFVNERVGALRRLVERVRAPIDLTAASSLKAIRNRRQRR